MGVGVRCFQCKQKVKGWGTGREHANATGHTWQPGYYCTDCETTFASHKLCKRHVKEAGIHSKSSPAKTSSVACPSDEPLFAPNRLVTAPLAVSVQVPRPDISLLSASGVVGTKTPDGPSPLQCTICRPSAAFSSKEALEQHLSETSTCTKCAIHFFEAAELQDHYRTTSAHPKCRECGDGFPGISEWATHRARCPPPPPPPPPPGAAAASSAQSTSAPQSISDGFSSAGSEDGVPRYDTGVDSEPASEVSSVASGSLPLHPAEVADRHDASDAVSDENSVARDALETPVTEDEDEDWDARSSSLQDAPLRVDKGKGKASSSNGAATPITVASTATTTLEGSQKPEARAAKRLSFHCRSCLADPCVKPVATLCGHIFCHSCIVRELATRMGCPLCQRPFFVRLDVGVGS